MKLTRFIAAFLGLGLFLILFLTMTVFPDMIITSIVKTEMDAYIIRAFIAVGSLISIFMGLWGIEDLIYTK